MSTRDGFEWQLHFLQTQFATSAGVERWITPLNQRHLAATAGGAAILPILSSIEIVILLHHDMNFVCLAHDYIDMNINAGAEKIGRKSSRVRQDSIEVAVDESINCFWSFIWVAAIIYW